MRHLRIILCAAAALMVNACTQIGITAANLPAHFAEDITTVTNVTFDTDHKLSMDIYTPENADNAAVVVFFYGGRWQDGSKSDYAFVGNALAKKGYIVAIPDYRKYPDVKFPAFVQDGANAVAWIHDHIRAYGGDPARIAVMGHSAGAHTAALLAADNAYLQALGKVGTIKAFVGLAGPYEFIPEEDDLKDIFGPPANYPLMHASTYIDGREPPMLLLHGASDDLVGQFNLEKLAARIQEKGGRVETKIYPGIDHVWMIGALSWLGQGKAPVLNDVTTFLQKIIPPSS